MNRALGRRGRRRRVKKNESGRRREEAIPVALKEGATKREHRVEAAEARGGRWMDTEDIGGGLTVTHVIPGRKGQRSSEVPAKVTTVHDVADDAKRDADILSDSQVQDALAIARQEQPNIETSPVKKYESALVTAEHVTKVSVAGGRPESAPAGSGRLPCGRPDGADRIPPSS